MVFRREANYKQRVKGITDVVSSADGDLRKRCPGPGRAGKYRTAERPVAGLPQRASQCWPVHPKWGIGNIEVKAGGQPSLDSHPRYTRRPLACVAASALHEGAKAACCPDTVALHGI